MEESRPLLQLDSRRRLSLGAFAKHVYYLVDVADDGVITLTPATISVTGKREDE